MKKYFLSVLILLLIMAVFCAAQVRDSLIQLTTQIGDTISIAERNYYDLYPNIKDFQSAMIYLRDDTIAVSRITYLGEDSLLIDTLLTNRGFYIGNLRAHIRQIDNERPAYLRKLEEEGKLDEYEKMIEPLTLVTVTIKDGNKLNGWLYSVQRSNIVLIPIWVTSENEVESLKDTIAAQKIQTVFIEGNNYVASSLGIGVLIGAAVGVFVGLSAGDDPSGEFFSMTAGDKAIAGGLALGLIGGVVGLVGGLLSSTSDETIAINSAADLELLKKYLVQN
jgi:small nuclear ribonucleoprotein (snRNP)-like protein